MIEQKAPARWAGIVSRYSQFVDTDQSQDIVTLAEGNTPLVKAKAFEALTGVQGISVYFKLEGMNPTGSFKDRGMTVAVTQAIKSGLRTMVCASTGNTSASAAAYAAAARALGYTDARCAVLIPDGYVALGKLAQAMAYGADIIQIQGNFDQALQIVRDLCEQHPIALVNSVNPYRIEGQKTAAFEVCEQLGGQAPDVLCIPVGNAGNITAYWKGFCEFQARGIVSTTPQMRGFQAAGSAPIVQGHPIANPETIATAIRIGNPASWASAETAARDSGGEIEAVTDEEILDAYKLIHSAQGVTCEPASAASVAGLLKAAKAGKIAAGSTVVCVLTGHGLKDPDTALQSSHTEPLKVKAELDSVLSALGM